MKWLVQEFINSAENSIRIARALDALSTEYLLIRINKDNTLSVIDKESKVPLDNSASLIQDFVADENVMTYGSKLFDSITRAMNLTPGSFINEDFEFDKFREVLGDELLNSEFLIGELSELEPIADEFFIRPTGNTKIIAGMVINRDDFLSWKERERKIDDSIYIGHPLMISPLQSIEAEYRFFVVNQVIVAGSSYMVSGDINISKKPSYKVLEYTNKMIDKFPLSKAFVIDIAETKEGLKVIEYNNINTSGLYGADEFAFVEAINNMTI